MENRESVKKRIIDELRVWGVDFSWDSFLCFKGEFDELQVQAVQWEPEEFMDKAVSVQHPMDRKAALPMELRFAILQMATKQPYEIAKHRAEFFKYWSRRAVELEPDEAALRAKMDPVVCEAVKDKRLVLFREMLDFYKYPDMGVFDEMVAGATLTGEVQITGMLPSKFVPALITEQDLRTQSLMRRPLIEADYKGSGDLEVDKEVWKQTLQECERGWLAGPLTADEVPKDAPVSKRFGWRQRHKIRLIDDFSESAVNQSVTVSESPTLHTVDVACAILACWFGDSLENKKKPDLQVKTFDLASAYRQVALSESGRAVAYIRVFDPSSGKWAYFQAKVLPFGAVKSVHSFLRMARAIWWLGTVACWLVWSSFFDDYILFSAPEIARSTDFNAATLFTILGWQFAKEGRKCVPFSTACEALGVIFNLEFAKTGVCLISNTESRIQELVCELQKVISAGFILQSDAQRLRGRMQFSEAQIYGRTGRRCTRALKEAASRRRTKLIDAELLSLRLFAKLLQVGKPRTVSWDARNSLVIFTDASYERDAKDLVCGLGGVLLDSDSGLKLCFSTFLDEKQRSVLGEMTKQQIIFEAETFCAVLAYLFWMKRLEQRNPILFVDNEGTKFCLMKGSSDNATVDVICSIFAELELQLEAACWLSRVPSHSNIADAPSRGDVHVLAALGFEDQSVMVSGTVDMLLSFISAYI